MTVGDLVHLVGSSKGDAAVYVVIALDAKRARVTYCGSDRWYVPVWHELTQLVPSTEESKHTRRARRRLEKAGFDADGWKRINCGAYGREELFTVTHVSMEDS